MSRYLKTASMLLLIFLNACTGYKTLSIPSEPPAQPSEFSHPASVEKGDQVRLTFLDGSIAEGHFVSMDSLSITIDSSPTQTDPLQTDIDSVLHFEVKGGSTLKTLGLMAAGVVVIATIYGVSEGKKATAEVVGSVFGDPK